MNTSSPIKHAKQSGWDDAFDRDETEQRGPEKPAHVLNARQLEYVAHIKRTQKEQKNAPLV